MYQFVGDVMTDMLSIKNNPTCDPLGMKNDISFSLSLDFFIRNENIISEERKTKTV